MAFDDLPPQPPMNLRADAYADTSLRLSRAAATATRTVLDVPFGDDWYQKLDVYLPRDEGLTGLPVYVGIHGGGWSHGFKEWMGLNAPPVVALPGIYVSLSYRLAPQHRHPAMLEDCLAGFAWVYRNIARYGGDPNRLFVGGHSAGGHLASLLTLRTDLHAQYGLPKGVVKACFPCSGIYATHHEDGSRVNTIAPMVGEAYDDRTASPMTYIARNTVPFFVTWAENDNANCKLQGPWFLRELRKQPGRAEGYEFPQFDHFWITIDQQRAENPATRTLLSWMAGDPATAPVFRP